LSKSSSLDKTNISYYYLVYYSNSSSHCYRISHYWINRYWISCYHYWTNLPHSYDSLDMKTNQ